MVLPRGMHCLLDRSPRQELLHLHLCRQAGIDTSKNYIDALIKVFEHINLVLAITASEVEQNKSGAQHRRKWKYFSCSRSGSGWQLCLVEQKSCISCNGRGLPNSVPALSPGTGPAHGQAAPACSLTETSRMLHRCPKFIIQSLSGEKVCFADWSFLWVTVKAARSSSRKLPGIRLSVTSNKTATTDPSWL